jgi:GNAT superfamily N-acetyltransferase
VSVSLRPAVAGDADELARLRWEFRIEDDTQASMTFVEFLAGFRRFATRALGDPERWRAWIAEDDGRMVGCVWLQLVERIPHPGLRDGERPIAYVTNMYVAPPLRNGGLGRRLLDAAVGFARERRAGVAIVWPSERSLPFYERAGFGRDGAPLVIAIEGD